jgi:FkbM family methyltransferase
MTVLDVGANIGFFSLEVLRRCGGAVNLLAFEPAPDTFARLERNLATLFPDAPVRAYRRALADRPGEATLYHRPRVSVTSSLHPEPLGDSETLLHAMLRRPPAEYRNVFPVWFRRLPRRAAEVLLRVAAAWAHGRVVETPCTVTTISAVLRDHAIQRVDFLKVDVEGAELDVLRGIEPGDWPAIQRLAVEVHDLDSRVERIRQMLEDARFDDVQITQEWPFEGTNIYMVHAARSTDPARTPAS